MSGPHGVRWFPDDPPTCAGHEPSRWIDLVDIAALVAGRPRPSYEEADFVLWERTPWPLGDDVDAFTAALAYFKGET